MLQLHMHAAYKFELVALSVVCVVDPRQLLQELDRMAAVAEAVRIRVPTHFLPEIAAGVFELGDSDEPTNELRFGKPAEFFQYTFVGRCSCPSGYVGLIPVAEVSRSSGDWSTLQNLVNVDSPHFPDKETGFLFVGPVIQADSVSIYKYEEGTLRGLLISSDAEEMD